MSFSTYLEAKNTLNMSRIGKEDLDFVNGNIARAL